MNANDPGTSVLVSLLPFGFFFLWLMLSRANPERFASRKLSKGTFAAIVTPLIALTVGMLYLLLNPQASRVMAPSVLVPPPAAIADPPKPPQK